MRKGYTRPFRALKTQAIAKKPMPTDTNPQPATSSYLKAPSAINPSPTTIMIKVAQANTVFLFIIFVIFWAFPRESRGPAFWATGLWQGSFRQSVTQTVVFLSTYSTTNKYREFFIEFRYESRSFRIFEQTADRNGYYLQQKRRP